MAGEGSRHIDSSLGATHMAYKWDCVRRIAHYPRLDALNSCAGIVPATKIPLHVAIKVLLCGRRDQPVVGNIVIPGGEVPDECFPGATDNDTVVGRALNEIIH